MKKHSGDQWKVQRLSWRPGRHAGLLSFVTYTSIHQYLPWRPFSVSSFLLPFLLLSLFLSLILSFHLFLPSRLPHGPPA